MKRTLWIGIILLGSINNCTKAANKSFNDSLILEKSRTLIESPKIITSDIIYYYECVERDSQTYFRPNGTLHLFSLNDHDDVTRLDRSIFHGNTFFSQFFIHGDHIFLFGGSGLFTSSLNLLSFDKITKEWERITIEGLNEDGHVIFMHHSGDSLFFLFDESDRMIPSLTNLKAGLIDLNNFTFEQTGISFFKEECFVDKRLEFCFHNQRYSLFQSKFAAEGNAILFDSKTNTFYNTKKHFSNVNLAFGGQSHGVDYFQFISDDVLVKMDVNLFLSEAEIIANTENIQEGQNLALVLMAIAIIAVGISLIFAWNNMRNKRTDTDELTQIIMSLNQYLEEDLSADKLVEIFNLTDRTPDSQRVSKNQIIEKINTTGVIKISRVKSKLDKRIVLYRISKN